MKKKEKEFEKGILKIRGDNMEHVNELSFNGIDLMNYTRKLELTIDANNICVATVTIYPSEIDIDVKALLETKEFKNV